ncbi:hypothetical protein S1OALGB6SA_1128 [Olavius algarvensis spirochete endosymbiont]|nr:hypothetical protein S1OALGB6SA_1128 [Olavius algarvensis spirochete endosymbiont]
MTAVNSSFQEPEIMRVFHLLRASALHLLAAVLQNCSRRRAVLI